MKHALLLILAAIPLASPAKMYDAEYETCSQSTTIGIVECVDEAGKKWDKRLNTAYQALVQRSEPGQNNASFLSIYNKSPYNRKKPYGDMHTNVHFEQEVSTAGGSAVFGWMEDTKQVVLMTHAKYLPALTLAATSREIEFTHALESVSQAPRYLMTCVWQREDDQIAPALRLYAERDDANSNAKIEKDSQSVLVSWVAVPASRAEKRFAAHDYCAEVAASERSSVPLWEEVLWN